MSYTTDMTSSIPRRFLEFPKSREMVNHPAHYQTSSGMEVIDVIEAFGLGFLRGNVIKYLLRAGHKDDILQDLNKAKWYLEREISNIEKARKNSTSVSTNG